MVALSAKFDYTLRDLYMSFSDTNHNQWSILFDGQEAMRNFIQCLCFTLCHIGSHQDSEDTSACLVRSLPCEAPGADETPITSGMAAGIFISVWELGEVDHYPGDVLSNCPPIKRVQRPDDVLKIK